MAFTGRKIQTPKNLIRSQKAMILLIKASDAEALVPADQTVKSMAVPRANILFFGLGEYDTVKAPTEDGEVIKDHDGNDIVLDKDLNGELTVLGKFENNELDDIEEETWTVVAADPKTVYAMDGFSSAAASMAAITAGQTFTAHEVFHKVKISGNSPNDYGTAQRSAFKFNKELESHSDGKFKGLTMTAS